MKAGRLVALLLTLQTTRGATAARLADDLEVSVRTIYRDVAALQAAGVPLWTEPGPHGGIRLLDGWRTRLDGLTADEAASLFLGGVPTALNGLGLGTVAVAAQAKVLATLPPELRDRASRLRERFHLDAPGWFQRSEEVPHLGTIADGVWERRRIRVTYRRGEDQVPRTWDPLGLVLKAGVWYVAARGDHGRILTYRVSRVLSAEPVDVVFDRPEGFDLAAWWTTAQASFDADLRPVAVRLRLGPHGYRELGRILGEHARAEMDAGAGPADAEGRRTVTVGVESERVALHQLCSLGGDVEVLAPASLRAALAEVGAAMAARNG